MDGTANTGMALPCYQSHKKVWALKIAEVKDTTAPGNESDGSRLLVFEDERYATMRVKHDYVRKHNPKAGGYWVRYADGYESWSPADVFEDGYTIEQIEILEPKLGPSSHSTIFDLL